MHASTSHQVAVTQLLISVSTPTLLKLQPTAPKSMPSLPGTRSRLCISTWITKSSMLLRL